MVLFELFCARTVSNPVETSGDDSDCISETHHMRFITLRSDPLRLNWTLYIFRQSHTYTCDLAAMTHGLMKVFPVCTPVQRGWWEPPLR